MDAIEEEARRLTWRAWRLRDDGRLFGLPEIPASDPELWPKLDAEFNGKAVGVVPPLDGLLNSDSSLEYSVVVGVWLSIGRGFTGICLHVMHFSGPGSTTCRAPSNIGFVHVLPEIFQRRAAWCLYDEDAPSNQCDYCSYVFKYDEQPCTCHWGCGACCLSLTTAEKNRGKYVHP